MTRRSFSQSRVNLDSQKSRRLWSNMHIWEGVSVRAEQWRRVTDKVITIEQAYAVTTIHA